MKRTLIGGLFAAATLFGGLALTSPTSVSAAQEVCPDLQTGKISSTQLTVTITADPGFLISEYCFKAGSDESVETGAVEYVQPVPGVASVTFSGPDGKAVSRFSYSQVKIPADTTTTTTATTMPGMVTPPTPGVTPIEGQVASNSPVGPQAAGPAAPAAGGVIAAAPTQLASTGTSSWVMAIVALAALAGRYRPDAVEPSSDRLNEGIRLLGGICDRCRPAA